MDTPPIAEENSSCAGMEAGGRESRSASGMVRPSSRSMGSDVGIPNAKDLMRERNLTMAALTGHFNNFVPVDRPLETEPKFDVVPFHWHSQDFFLREGTEGKDAFEGWLQEDQKSATVINTVNKGLALVGTLCSNAPKFSDSSLAECAFRYQNISFTFICTVAFSCLALASAFGFTGLVWGFVYPKGASFTETFAEVTVSALYVVPILVLLDAVRTLTNWSTRRTKALEATIYVLFIILLFLSAQQASDPEERFALRTRVLDMVLDEYSLEGVYPGNLLLSGEIGEIYEWLEGPIAQHFICEEPPAPFVAGSSVRPMCVLPDGSFLSDNLVELRQLRVKPLETAVQYYSATNRVTVSGRPAPHGGKYNEESNRDYGPTWTLNGTDASGAAEQPFTLAYGKATYRSQMRDPSGQPIEVSSMERWGWYSAYHFGGFVLTSNRSAGKQSWLDQVRMLQNAGWIDAFTRAVTVSTVLLNPATGLGAFVTVLVELPDTGVIRITPDVLVTPRTGVVGVEDEGALNQVVLSYTLRLQGVFFFYALLSQLSRWFYKGTYAYFSKLGNHFEVTIIAMVGWVLKDYLIVRYRYPDLDGADAPYLNLQAGYTINYTMQRASTITGILLWLLILRVLKFVPQLLGSRLHLFSHTVENAAWDLLAFFATSTVIIFAFTAIFHFTLGSYLNEFATLPHAFYTVILGLSSVWEPAHWYEADPFTSICLMLAFTAICTWMLATMVIAIVTESFVAAKADIALKDRRHKLQLEQRRMEWMDWVHRKPDGTRPEDNEVLGKASGAKRTLHRALNKTNALWRMSRSSLPSCRSRKHTSVESIELSPSRLAEGGEQEEGVGQRDRWKEVLNATSNARSAACGGSSGGESSPAGAPSGSSLTPCSARSGKVPRQSLMAVGRAVLDLAKKGAAGGSSADGIPEIPIYQIKGCLWRGTDLDPNGENNFQPFVRIHVLGAAEDLPVASTMSGASDKSKHTAYGGREVLDQFRSKTLKMSGAVEGLQPQCDWNERFIMHAQGHLHDLVVVIALYERQAYGREALISYTNVPMMDIVRQSGGGIPDRASPDGRHDRESPPAPEQKPKPMLLEFTLHPAQALQNKDYFDKFFRKGAAPKAGSGGVAVEPKLQLSIGVHASKRRKMPMRSRTTARRGAAQSRVGPGPAASTPASANDYPSDRSADDGFGMRNALLNNRHDLQPARSAGSSSANVQRGNGAAGKGVRFARADQAPGTGKCVSSNV